MPDFRDTRVSLAGLGVIRARALSAATSGVCLASVGGTQVFVRVVAGLTVALGDVLLILRQQSTYWAIGVVGSAPAVPPAPPAADPTPPPPGDPSPPPKPVVTTGVLTCAPVSTATYRDGSWRSDVGPVDSADTYQGRYGGSGFGRSTGCAFYGSKPRTIAGATVTHATIHALRLSSGDYARRTPTLRLLSQATRPGGAPTLNESTSGPSLGVLNQVSPWQDNAFVIPNSWAQAMVNGTRGGIAISIGSDSPYIRFAGRGSWSAAWVLNIGWRRG